MPLPAFRGAKIADSALIKARLDGSHLDWVTQGCASAMELKLRSAKNLNFR
jgi:hypothetical protein